MMEICESMMEIKKHYELIKFIPRIHIILQSVFFQCQLGIGKRRFFCQSVQIYNIIWVIKDYSGITFLTTDNKNRVLAGINNDGVRSRIMHTKLEIKILVHGSLLPKDISHHPTGQ